MVLSTVRSITLLSTIVILVSSILPVSSFGEEVSFSPAPGEYTDPISVVLQAPEETRVHYTLDGTEPSSSSPAFSGSLAIDDDTVIRYFTVGPDGSRSSVQEAFYRIRLKEPAEGELRTVADPPAGMYTKRVRVTLTTKKGATIYYTIDGSDPSTRSDIYKSPLTLTVDTQLKFFAVDTDGSREQVREELYRFQLTSRMVDTTPPQASVAPLPAGYRAGDLIRLSANEEVRIYYTLDGEDPTDESLVYEGPFWLTESAELRFMAVDEWGNRSRIYSETYHLDQEPPSSEAFLTETDGTPVDGGYICIDGIRVHQAFLVQHDVPDRHFSGRGEPCR